MKQYRILASIVAWTGLALMFLVMISNKSGVHLWNGIVNYFSYFTILSNILVALSFTFSWLGSQTVPGRFFLRPAVRAGIAVYITVTGLVYLLILSDTPRPNEMSRFATIILHYVVPPMYVVDWLLFVPKRTLSFGNVSAWPLFPLAYAAYTLVRGTWTGYYPYPFMNAAKLGYARVGMNCLYLLVAIVALGLLFVAIDRKLGSVQGGRSKAPASESAELL